MTRPVFFLLFAWTAFFGPAIACSRNNQSPAIMQQVSDTSRMPGSDTAGRMYSYLALGDSYTIGTSISAAGSYPVQTTSLMNQQGTHFSAPFIVATNGWTTTDLLAALADTAGTGIRADYDIVTLLIGVNNQYQGGSIDNYRQEFSALLDKSISFAGNRPGHVIVLSIPDYSLSPFGQGRKTPGIPAAIDGFNKVNKSITAAKGARYLDVTGYTRSTSLFAPDGLHYSADEYALWAHDVARLFQVSLTD